MHDGVLYVPPLPDVEVEISDVVDISVIFTHCLLEVDTDQLIVTCVVVWGRIASFRAIPRYNPY